MKTPPTDADIAKYVVPRLKELAAAGCKVFIEFDNLPQEIVAKHDKVYAKWIEGNLQRLTSHFFCKLFESDYGPEYVCTVEDIMSILSVDITVANYKEKITALTQKA